MAMVQPSQTQNAEPTWEIAHLFPNQGHWSEHEYLSLDTNRLIEFDNGYLQVLPVPTESHQRTLQLLFKHLDSFAVERTLGEVLFAPIPVRTGSIQYREPDLLFVRYENTGYIGEKYWTGADLVMEVVSPDDSDRDYVTKRSEYAQAGIPEYWIVDPSAQRITVLWLEDDAYAVHGEFAGGERATSRLLDGFAVDVDEVFAAATS